MSANAETGAGAEHPSPDPERPDSSAAVIPRGYVRGIAFAIISALLLYASSCGPVLLGTQLLKERYPTATWIEDVVFIAYYPHLDLAFLSEGYFNYLNRFWIKGGAGFQTHEDFKYAWAQRSGYPGHEKKP